MQLHHEKKSMRKTILIVFLCVILIYITGCNINQGEPSHGEGLTQTALQETIDFSMKENWESAYPYMEHIGRPVNQFAANYLEWEYHGWMDGGFYFKNPETGVMYIFLAEELDDYDGDTPRRRYLTGSESCCEIAAEVQMFFPEASWPDDKLKSEEYLDHYLGIDFELQTEDEDSENYFAILLGDRLWMEVYTEDGLIFPENVIIIHYMDNSQYEFWKRYADAKKNQ